MPYAIPLVIGSVSSYSFTIDRMVVDDYLLFSSFAPLSRAKMAIACP